MKCRRETYIQVGNPDICGKESVSSLVSNVFDITMSRSWCCVSRRSKYRNGPVSWEEQHTRLGGLGERCLLLLFWASNSLAEDPYTYF